MSVKPGMRLFGTTYDTQVIIGRACNGEIDLRCCAAPIREGRPDASGATSDPGGGPTQLGKRYVDDEAGIELPCSKAGGVPLTWGGRPMGMKAPKVLPASD